MGRSKSLSATSKKAIKKQAMEVPEMATATLIWPSPTTKKKHLQRLLEQGLLLEQKLKELRAPGEHRIPNLEPGEIVLFVQAWARIACLPFLAWVLALFWHYPKSFAPKCNPTSFNLCSSL
jgi:hypothetical protein